jgi:hypothetical protein
MKQDTTAPPPDIYVKCTGSDYTTNTIRGKRASCTHSAEEAARRLAAKLYGDQVERVDEVKEGNVFTRLFRVVLKAPATQAPVQ